MLLDIESNSTLFYYKTTLIVLTLTVTITPLLWILSQGNIQWVLMATLLWTLGSIIVFHPFIEYLYPHMLTKIGIFLLSSVLTVISILFNVSIISFLLPFDYIYHAMINATLSQISIFGWFYIMITTTLISYIEYSQDKK